MQPVTEEHICKETNLNPWPETDGLVMDDALNSFDDNFIKPNECNQINQNGLQLPDSEHYLSVLEKKLYRIQKQSTNKEGANKATAKEILKSLTVKRDAIFQQEFVGSTCEELEEATDSNKLNSISSLITNTALYNTLEKKMFPQSHAIDSEELKKLIEADLLNTIRNLEQDDNKTDCTNSANQLN